MKQKTLNRALFSLGTAIMLGLSGCGDSSDNEVNTPYGDTVSIVGSIEQISQRKQEISLAKSDAKTPDEMVKLFSLLADGSMKDTNISCKLAIDKSYSCDNIKVGKEYVVRYSKKIDNNKTLELKANVNIPTGLITRDVPIDVPVTKMTTVISESIMKAIDKAVLSVPELTEQQSADIITNLVKAIEPTVKKLIESGTIKIPADNDFMVNGSFDGAPVVSNVKLNDEAGTIISDKNVTQVLNVHQSLIGANSFGTLYHKDLIAKIFEQMQPDDQGTQDIPEWVLNVLTEKYDYKFSLADLKAHIIFFKPDGSDYFVDQMKLISDKTSDEVNSAIYDAIDRVNSKVEDGELKKAFLASIAEYKKALAKHDIKILSKYPPTIGVLFKNWDTSSTTFDNVGQSLVYLLYAKNVYARSIVTSVLDKALELNGKYNDILEHQYVYDLDPSFIFMSILTEDDFKKFDKPSGTLDVDTKMGIFTIKVDSLGWIMEDPFTFNKDKFQEMKIKYPTVNGVVTKTITNINQLHVLGMWESGFGLSYDASNEITPDLVTGDYTVSITYDNQTITTTKHLYVIDNLEKYQVKFKGSLGQSEVSKTILPTTDKQGMMLENLRVEWDDTDLQAKVDSANLPADIRVVYEVVLNHIIQDEQVNIFNSSWQKQTILGNSIVIPEPLVKNSDKEDDFYVVSVIPLFIDKTTRQKIAEGAVASTSFTVGNSTTLVGSENINLFGKVKVSKVNHLKVAVGAKKCTYNDVAYIAKCTTDVLFTGDVKENGDYSLKINAKKLQEKLRENNRVNAFLTIFDDKKDSGKIQQDDKGSKKIYFPTNKYLRFTDSGQLEVHIGTNDLASKSSVSYIKPGESIFKKINF